MVAYTAEELVVAEKCGQYPDGTPVKYADGKAQHYIYSPERYDSLADSFYEKIHNLEKLVQDTAKIKSVAELYIDDDELWESLYVGTYYTNYFPIGSGGISINLGTRIVSKAKMEIEFTNQRGERIGLITIRRA